MSSHIRKKGSAQGALVRFVRGLAFAGCETGTCGKPGHDGATCFSCDARALLERIEPAIRVERTERKYLEELTASVRGFIARLDAEMKKPSDEGRGKRIAGLTNALEQANDRTGYFGLGIDFRTDLPKKGKTAR